MSYPLVQLVEDAAKARGDSPVPRDYITEALEKIEKGDIEVEKYPTRLPSLKQVYKIASKIYEESRPRKR